MDSAKNVAREDVTGLFFVKQISHCHDSTRIIDAFLGKLDAVSRLRRAFLLANRKRDNISVDGVKSRHGNFRLLQEIN